MKKNRRDSPAIRSAVFTANSFRADLATSWLKARSRRMNRMSSRAAAASRISEASCRKVLRSSARQRIAAQRAISRSTSRRTSSMRRCDWTLKSDTRTPRRGRTTTSPTDSKGLGKPGLGKHRSRSQDQGNDALLEFPVGLIGQAQHRFTADVGGAGAFAHLVASWHLGHGYPFGS
jgi:hypothetical protein